MPSVSFDMAQQQNPQQYDPRLEQQQSQSSQRSSSLSTAQLRGHNWALPNMHTASMGVQRPIRVECYADRLILLPDTHDREAQTIPLGERTDDAVDQLVAAVRTYTKSWHGRPRHVLEAATRAQRESQRRVASGRLAGDLGGQRVGCEAAIGHIRQKVESRNASR